MERLTERLKNTSYCISDIRAIRKECFYEDMECRHGVSLYTGKAIDRLAEYEDLEEQGKLLKLPVAVGDMLFVLTEDSPTGIEETKCKSIVFNSKNNFTVCAPCQYDDWGQAKWRFKKTHFGKTVFLTRESAEAALKEMSE